MTVGIGVLADWGGVMILATDLPATFPKLSTPNEECGKAWGLPTPFDGGIPAAGIIRDCQPFADQLFVNLKKLRTVDPIYNEQCHRRRTAVVFGSAAWIG
jgi:hypothetical protein